MPEKPEFALSIRQPWAWAILHAGKGIENRTWCRKFRGRIRVHAGKTIDREGIRKLKEMGIEVPESLPVGGYVGEVTITDCIDKHAVDTGSRWADESYGRYGFVLEEPVAYEHLVPAKGRLGIYRVTDDRDNDGREAG